MPLQRGNKNLADAPYNLTSQDGQLTLFQKWVTQQGQTIADIKVMFPNLFERYNMLGWSDAQVAEMTLLPAYWNDWVLRGLGGGATPDSRIVSNNGVEVPAGDYLVNYSCIHDGGTYKGQGVAYSGVPGSANFSMGTTLTYDFARWIGGLGGTHLDGRYTTGGVTYDIVFDQRNLIQSASWQVLAGANSYCPYGKIEGFQLVGNNGGWWTGTLTANGIGLWDVGENFECNRILSGYHNGYGIICVRGTPASISNPSVSVNALGGIGLIGTSLNTIWIWGISGDDNPALVVQMDGYGRSSGGNLNIVGVKSESGKHTPYKGQCILWQRSNCDGTTTVSGVQMAMDYAVLDAMFCMQSGGWGQTLNVSGCYGWNFSTLVHDVTNQKRWAGAAYNPQAFVWCARNGGTYHDLITSTMVAGTAVNAAARLGVVGLGQTYNYGTGTPLYDITGGAPPPPPPTCTWVTGAWSAWGPCIGNVETRTRTVYSSVTGCTPAGAMPATSETQPCTVPPPTSLLYTYPGAFNNTVWSTSINLTPDIALVKRIVLTNATLMPGSSAVFSYQRIVVEAGTNPQGVRAVPQTNPSQARFRMPNGAYATMSDGTNPLTVVKTNTLYPTLEIVFPSAITVSSLLALPGSGSAMLLTSSGMSMYSQ